MCFYVNVLNEYRLISLGGIQMMDNHMYNLMMQMVDEHQSLYRIKNMYKKDAQNCKQCQAMWERLEKEKEDHIKQMQSILTEHLGGTGKKSAEQEKMKSYYKGREEKVETKW
jgi:hypothetical protein